MVQTVPKTIRTVNKGKWIRKALFNIFQMQSQFSCFKSVVLEPR